MNSIEIKNFTYSYPGAQAPTLKDVNLEIEKGDFLAIVGNNGCGKSTLCKVMNGLIPHFITGDFQGEVLVGGISTLEADIGTLAQKAGYVYQDFENQIVRPTVLDDASYACMNYGMKDYKERGLEALDLCGLTGRENDYVFQLSGGQTHLLALAGAVSLQPEVLILDEPIAQLDPHHADRIYEILRELNEKQGKTIIVIEHHTEYIADYCKHVMLLKDGHVEWKLPAKEALSRVEELQACNIFPPQVTLAAYGLEKKGAIPHEKEYPSTVEDGKKAFQNLTFDKRYMEFRIRQKQTEPSVEYRHAAVSYRSVKGEPRKIFEDLIFEDLDLEICRGEKIALIGSNGAGKSTLMKMMTGLLKPSSGDVFIKDINTRKARPENLSKYVSLVYQNPEDMFIKDSIENDISFAMKVRGVKDWEERTGKLLERFRLTSLKDRDGRLLSGGQMRRASLAIGVALDPEILLLDEPTANLDIQGKIIADGTRDEIFGNEEAVRRAGIRPPEIFTMGQALDKEAYCYTVDEFVKGFGG